MRHEHEKLEIEDLRVDVEVVGNTLVQDDIPDIRILLVLRRVITDTIAPCVPDLANIVLQFFHVDFLGVLVRILDELKVEFVEVGLDVDTLHGLVVPVIDEHEVGVDFPAAILAKDNTHMVVKAFIIDARDCSVLEQR